ACLDPDKTLRPENAGQVALVLTEYLIASRKGLPRSPRSGGIPLLSTIGKWLLTISETLRSLNQTRPPDATRRLIYSRASVRFPGRVPRSPPIPLQVRLVSRRERLSVDRLPHEAADNSVGLPLLRVTVSVAAENFVIEGEKAAEILVPMEGASLP